MERILISVLQEVGEQTRGADAVGGRKNSPGMFWGSIRFKLTKTHTGGWV